jgi:uncharacterized protein YecE (DUF72 family)
MDAVKQIRIGCQSWGYDDWITPAGGEHIFYPAGTRRSEMLPFYSKVFDTIEVDATLYGIPAASTLEKWYGETPEGFTFSLKFPREITHDRRLAPASIPVMEEFTERARLLADKLGLLLIQLPPSFDGSRENGRNLREFCARLPRDLRFAVEFRHIDWFIDWTWQELAQNGLSPALVEGPWLPRELVFESAGKVPADFIYVRVMGERDLEKFDRIYRHRDAVLEQWSAFLEKLNAREIFIYCDNYFEGFAPATAVKLQRLLGLPESDPADHQDQGSLF